MENSQDNLTRANIKEKKVTNSMISNMEGKYNQLKQKIDDLEKNNDEMKILYKTEEERLKKTNSLIFLKTDEGRVQYIKELENTTFNLKKDCGKLKSLINEKKTFSQYLSSNENEENKKYNCFNQKEIEKDLDNEANDENLRNLIDELKLDFEKKISLKLKELKDYYDEKNGVKKEEPVYVPPKPLSLEQSSEKKPENVKFYEIHSIHYNTGLSETDIQLIDTLIAVQCFKEEYPKEFFIDYIFNEVELANLNDDYNLKESLQLKRIEQNKKFHNSMAVTTIYVAKNIAKIFDINSSEDINMICKYLNNISKKELCAIKYEEEEKKKYQEEHYFIHHWD